SPASPPLYPHALHDALPIFYLLSSYSDTIYSRANLIAATKYDHLLESCREDPPSTEHTEDHIRELWSTFWLGQVMIISGVGIVIDRKSTRLNSSHVSISYPV